MPAPSSAMLASTSGSLLAAPRPFAPASRHPARLRPRSLRLATRAEASGAPQESDEDFEARLAALKSAKGQTPLGQGKKKETEKKVKAERRTDYDFSSETLWREFAPSYGDLAVNLALGVTLLWLPLTFAAVGRTAFVKYRFTDRRLSVVTTAPWESKQLDAAYQEVKEVRAIGRGVGLWGDMVVELRNGDKVEMRAVPQWQEVRDYIQQRAKELQAGAPAGASSSGGGSASGGGKGFAA